MWGLVGRLLDRDSLPALAAPLWDADPDSFEFVWSGANMVFRFAHPRAGTCYLRVTHPKVRRRVEVESALDFHAHVARAGASVCTPVPSARGAAFEELRQGEEQFMASAVSEAPGRPLGPEDRAPEVVRALGRSIGELHRAQQSYAPSAERWFWDWRRIWSEVERRLDRGDPLASAEFDRVDAWARRLSESQDFGMTHGDYNLGNVLWDGQRVWTIDFDEPLQCWYAADLARPFRDYAALPLGERRAILANLVEGYRSVRPFAEHWLGELPWFMRMKDLEVYTWALREGRADPELLAGGQPLDEALATLRARLERPLDW
jgi:Ser/Thr protein kinase RdoA (MazF antagonist)